MAAGMLALAACGGSDPEPGGAAGADGGTDPPVDLSFTVPTVDGGEFAGTSLAGKPAVLWFWAPWCVTCVAEAPHVSALADDYAGQVTVVGVAGLDDSIENMQQFIDLTDIANFPQLADPDGVVWQRFEITEQSSFVILDEHGVVDQRGLLNPADLPAQLDRLVA
ncbi:MAG: redoxin domain-containing protein [Micromonosporaceae bacterium]|nr:redoxin domain-containing protein [Micromonosporaceae bacterium]